MKRYEYKVVTSTASVWRSNGDAAEAERVELLNREGRSGWRLVPTHQPGPFRWNAMLLEREVD